jgi:hypothetical protein
VSAPFLAWPPTGLSVIAFGFVVDKLSMKACTIGIDAIIGGNQWWPKVQRAAMRFSDRGSQQGISAVMHAAAASVVLSEVGARAPYRGVSSGMPLSSTGVCSAVSAGVWPPVPECFGPAHGRGRVAPQDLAEGLAGRTVHGARPSAA